jgi:WD40 repeat protein
MAVMRIAPKSLLLSATLGPLAVALVCLLPQLARAEPMAVSLAPAPVAQGPPSPRLVVRHKGEAVSAAFSPDGTLIASGSGYNPIIVWDAKTGEETRRIEGAAVGDFLTFSPDGKLLASARNWMRGNGAGDVYLWDVTTGKPAGQLKGDNNLLRCVAFSPDGKRIAGHSQFGAVRVWEVATGKELVKIPTNDAGHTVAFSPDGKLLAFDVNCAVRLCDADTGKERLNLRGHQDVRKGTTFHSGLIEALAFSPDGKLLASTSWDTTARLWDVATGQSLFVLEGHDGVVNAAAFVPDGKTLLTGGEDGTIRLWDTAVGKPVGKIQAHHSEKRPDGDLRKDLFSLAFSSDGKRLASAGRDRAVRIWEVADLLKARPAAN